MQQADVIVHDRLVSQPILDMCRRDAERIYVGKERDDHAVPQEEINLMLVRLAKEGKRTCASRAATLSSSDAAARRSKPWSNTAAVPGGAGITAAAGVASYAGIR